MTDFQVHITRLHSDRSFENFALSIPATLSEKSTITIDPLTGRGFIRKVNPENGLSLRLWNVILNHQTRLFKHALRNSKAKGFNLVYILTPEHCQLRTIGTHTQFNNY